MITSSRILGKVKWASQCYQHCCATHGVQRIPSLPAHYTRNGVGNACQSTIASSTEKGLPSGPGLEHFLANAQSFRPSRRTLEKISHPYVKVEDIAGHGRKVCFQVHGCQMNVSDVEVTWSVLKSVGYEKTEKLEEADVILVMTCAIREGAEQKIRNKLIHYRLLKQKRAKSSNPVPVKIGILGCMAERLKKTLLEEDKEIDLVMGPDSYRDLPRLLAITQSGDRVVNVLLSQEETYADIMPVSLMPNKISAFVSIMRGCDNMCSYCIVPFTRGRERSRPISSILEEIRALSDQGIKEITLLGQNVNSYCDQSQSSHAGIQIQSSDDKEIPLAKGFKTLYKPKKGGLRFSVLLDEVSKINPEIRVRFTSPHPKDFPDEVLSLINDRHNICNQLHMPAQAGNSRVLEVMRRGYSREAYLELVEHIREVIPNVALSSDFIAGFCSETEEEFQDTLSLMEAVRYHYCYVFPYSLREKTPAHRDLQDDVSDEQKADRLVRLAETFRRHALERNLQQVGVRQVVLVEGVSKRSHQHLAARNDFNTK
ncbi:Methylthiotransferase, partial [Trinorchestia longiramus]